MVNSLLNDETFTCIFFQDARQKDNGHRLSEYISETCHSQLQRLLCNFIEIYQEENYAFKEALQYVYNIFTKRDSANGQVA